MDKNSLLEQSRFWQVLTFILNCRTTRSITSLTSELEVTESELNSYLNFVQEIGVKLSFSKTEEGKFIELEEKPESIQLSFSLEEWLAFQAHFPKMAECEQSPYHDILKRRLLALEYEYSEHDLYSGVETLENILAQRKHSLLETFQVDKKEIVSFLEESLLDHKVVSMNTQQGLCKVLPYKMVFFDEDLNLIGEDVSDQCLVCIPLSSICSVVEVVDEYDTQFTLLEVEEFISSLRAISEQQIRLVLKIHSRKEFDLNFNRIYLERPVLFTNPQGDFIWAASLEPSNELYEWLCHLGPTVEILDPTSFKLQFIKYCEDKLKKIA